MSFYNFFKHITTADIVGLLVALTVMCAVAWYVSRFRKHPVEIVKNRNVFFIFSSILVFICAAVIGIKLANGSINRSLEFTGGTMLEIGFADQNIFSDDIAEEIRIYSEKLEKENASGLKEPIIQMITNPKVVEYPSQMRAVSITLSPAKPEDLSVLALEFGARLGKVQVDSVKSTDEPDTAVLKLLFENQEGLFVLDQSVNPEDGDKKIYRFADDSLVSGVIEAHDPNLKVMSLEVGELVTPKSASLEYKSAMIRVTKKDGNNLSNTEAGQLVGDIAKRFKNIYLFKQESIGPSVGAELARKAFLAIVVALVLQLIYITIRFNRQARYGITAVLSLVHDLVIMFGVYAIAGREIDSPFVAALLTVIGYSVMDSIIIFDRIRENIKLHRKESYEHIVNLSINQSMTRSVNTLLTVLMTLFALYFFGGETLKNFAFALIIGCSVGAYSSIFISAPMVVWADEYVKREKKEQLERKREEAENRQLEKAKSQEETKAKKRVATPTSLRASKKRKSKKAAPEAE